MPRFQFPILAGWTTEMGARVDYNGTIIERINRRIHFDEVTGCHLWTGTINDCGYGLIHYQGRNQRAHRVRYELECSAIDPKLDLDHLCRNRRCINPAHLEPVTRKENIRRSPIIGRQYDSMTHCRRGHEFTPENTRIYKETRRRCRACSVIQNRIYRAKIKTIGLNIEG